MSVQTATTLLFISCAVAFRSIPPEQCEVALKTQQGWVCGKVRLAEGVEKYVSFRSVPYGKPPLGPLRFAPLEPPDSWNCYLDATEDSPACPQKDIIYGHMTQNIRGQSEDCIYLNIHVPYVYYPWLGCSPKGRKKGLPILVMVHGGGFHSGSGLTDIHGPEYLMMTKKVIVMTMNFRINVFGFLSLGTRKIPGNQGLRDVIQALRWMKYHAPFVGGDPNDITLIGQSTGATMIHLLALSKACEGLFHRIILLSGHAIPIYFDSNPKYSEIVADKFLKYLGINSTDPDYTHDCLIKRPLEDIMYANSITHYDIGLTCFVPTEETVEYPGIQRILYDSPLKLLGKGHGSQYPMIIGFTGNECEFMRWWGYSWQMPQRIKKDHSYCAPRRLSYTSKEELMKSGNRIAKKCFQGNYSIDNFVNCFHYLFFAYPALQIAEWRAKCGTPTYLYKYTYESERSLLKQALWTNYKGAAHSEDLLHIFRVNSMMGDYISFPPKNKDDLMKHWMVTIVTNFIYCNNPTCSKGESQWPPVNKAKSQYQEIAKPFQYLMKEADPEEKEWMRTCEDIDAGVRNVTNELKKRFREADKNTCFVT